MLNSKKKGNRYELDVRKKYNNIGFNVETSRFANRKRDDQKVDLVGTGRLNIQCKHYKNFSVAKAIGTLKEMPKEEGQLNVAHIKITGKGAVVVINEDDWIKFVEKNISLFE